MSDDSRLSAYAQSVIEESHQEHARLAKRVLGDATEIRFGCDCGAVTTVDIEWTSVDFEEVQGAVQVEVDCGDCGRHLIFGPQHIPRKLERSVNRALDLARNEAKADFEAALAKVRDRRGRHPLVDMRSAKTEAYAAKEGAAEAYFATLREALNERNIAYFFTSSGYEGDYQTGPWAVDFEQWKPAKASRHLYELLNGTWWVVRASSADFKSAYHDWHMSAHEFVERRMAKRRYRRGLKLPELKKKYASEEGRASGG